MLSQLTLAITLTFARAKCFCGIWLSSQHHGITNTLSARDSAHSDISTPLMAQGLPQCNVWCGPSLGNLLELLEVMALGSNAYACAN